MTDTYTKSTIIASIEPCFDASAIARHFALMHRLARESGVDGKLVLATFTEGAAPVIQHFMIGDIAGMTNAALAFAGAPGANLYAPLAIMRPDLEPDRKGSESDIVAVLGLVVDGDADKGHETKLPLAAPYVLETSPGNHQHFLAFNEALVPDDAKPLAQALKRATGADCADDLSHVWRVPGTLNWPTAGKLRRGRSPEPFLVRIATQWRGDRIDTATMREALAAHWQEATRSPRSASPAVRNTTCPDKAEAFLRRLRDAGYFDAGPDARQRYIWAAKACAYELGDEIGRDLWERLVCWSGDREDEGVPADTSERDKRWRDCSNLKAGTKPVTFGTIISDAQKTYGWSGISLARQRTSDDMFGTLTINSAAGGMPLLAGQAAVATIGRPHLDRFLATAGTDTTPSDAPQLPEAMRDHPLFQPLNFSIIAIIASGRTDAAALDALAVLRAAHESTFDLVRDRVNVGPGDLDAACRRFDARVDLELRTESGWIIHAPSGKPEPSNTANIHKMLRILGCELRRNTWLERDEIRGGPWHDWTHVDDRVVRHILTEGRGPAHNFLPAKDVLWDTLGAFADANEVDPALDALQAMRAAWDGTPRLDTWLHRTCNVPDDAYHRAVGRRIIGGMVRRIRHPGCKLDEMAVLIGPQGIRKSELCSALAPLPGSFADGVKLGDESKELILLLAGKAVVEISEMGRRREAEIESVKAMLSKTADIGRTAYARTVRERPRRNIFVGTSNADHPLTDTSGNRRFLPIRVERIDIAWLRANRDQLIGEAAALEAAGERFDLLPEIWPLAAEHQEAARGQTDEELQLAELFTETPATTCAYATAADIAQLAVDSKWPRGNKVRGATMRRLGFRDVRVYVDGRQVRAWYRGPNTLPTNIADKAARYVIGRHADGRPRVIIRTPGS